MYISIYKCALYLVDSDYYTHIIIGAMASQITSLAIVYSTVHWGADQRKHQSSASLAFVRGSHRWPVNSPPKRPVTRIMFPSWNLWLRKPFSLSRIIKLLHSFCNTAITSLFDGVQRILRNMWRFFRFICLWPYQPLVIDSCAVMSDVFHGCVLY